MCKLLLTFAALWTVHAYGAYSMDLISNPNKDPISEYIKWEQYFDKHNQKNIAVLSSIGENSQPNQRYVGIEKNGDKKIVFYLGKDSSAVKDIEKNPKVSFIHLSEIDDGWLEVEVRGKADLLKQDKRYASYVIEQEAFKFVFRRFDEKENSFKNHVLKYNKDQGNWKFAKEVYSIPTEVLYDVED
jgi:hypothetical protein